MKISVKYCIGDEIIFQGNDISSLEKVDDLLK